MVDILKYYHCPFPQPFARGLQSVAVDIAVLEVYTLLFDSYAELVYDCPITGIYEFCFVYPTPQAG